MKILYLAHRIPYPPNKGDKIRSYNQVKYLAGRHDLDLVCLADDPADFQHVPALQAICRSVAVLPLPIRQAKIKGLMGLMMGRSISQGYFHRRAMQRIVDSRLRETTYDAVVCFSSPMAEYLLRSLLFPSNPASRIANPPCLVMDFCDVDSDKWTQYSRNTPFPLNRIYSMEGRRLLAFDARVNRIMDSSVFISTREAELFQTLVPAAGNIQVVPNGVDHQYFHPQPAQTKRPGNTGPGLIFTGAMDYQANVDGVLWFVQEVLPLIRERHPGVRLTIVGSNPRPEIRALDGGQITVTGFVPDIRPCYQDMNVSVVPLRMARGVQNKVIEAMAMAIPVVATSAAIQGIQPLTEDPLLVADSPRDFADSVCRILANPDLSQRLSTKGRQFVVERFDWNRNMALLEELLSRRRVLNPG